MNNTMMKYSGIEWLGEIPSNWKISKIKYETKIRNEIGICTQEDLYIGLENIESKTGRYVPTERTYDEGKHDVVRINDVLFNKLRPYLAKVHISQFDGFSTSEFVNFMFFTGNREFLFYYLISDVFINVVDNSTYGVKMPRANTNFIVSLPITYPSLLEQNQIVSFLNKKCSIIYSIINDLEKQIEILEKYKKSVITEAVTKGLNPEVDMKDVSLIGFDKTPILWDIKKIKNVCNLLNGDRSSSYPNGDDFVDEGIPFVNSENIHELTLDLSTCKYITEEKYKQLRGAKIEIGDILYCLRGSVGNCALNISETHGAIASSLVVIRPLNVSPKYLNYVFHSSVVEHQTFTLQNGAVASNLSAINVSNFKIPYPSKNEQMEISNHLDKKCAEIESIIEDKKNQVEIIKKYKNSLIYEYVTGKKRVGQGDANE